MQPSNVNLNLTASQQTSRESDVQWILQEAPVLASTFGADGLRGMGPVAFAAVVSYVEATISRSYAVARMAEAIRREVPDMEYLDADEWAEQIIPDPDMAELPTEGEY